MAGHSHWAKIKRAKGATDAKRGKIWSKIARKIIIAAKGGGDVAMEELVLSSESLDVASLEQQKPEGLAAFQKAEIEKWWPIIRAAGIKPE